MNERNIKLTDLAKGIDLDSLNLKNPIVVPDNQFRELLDQVIERSTLETVGSRTSFYVNEAVSGRITWLKIVRLPIRPDNAQDYELFNRWQGVLSSLHEWGYRVYFMLQRSKGQTGLYIGVRSERAHYTSRDAIEQIMEATSGSMPGIELHQLGEEEILTDLTMPMMGYQSIGAVTGLPSFFDETTPGVLQTLDPLAFGIRGLRGDERDYCLLVIADPIHDAEISDIMNRMRTLGSEIHSFVERTVNEGKSLSETSQKGLNQFALAQLPSVLGGLADCPVVAVPTSVGYGAAFGGVAALLGMLNSCASGVSVVNIDNGFGAGYLAGMIDHIGGGK